MKKLFLVIFALLLFLVGCDSIENSNNPTSPTVQNKIDPPEDLGLSGKWTMWFLHPGTCVEEVKSVLKETSKFLRIGHPHKPKCKISITYYTLLERFWLDIDPNGTVANRTWNSKTLYGQTTRSDFWQRCGNTCNPPYVEDGRLWEWVHYWWPFIFPSEDLLSGTVEGIMYKHPNYYLSWEITYSRKTLESLYRFRGELTLETGEVIPFWGRQTRRDPFVIIPLNSIVGDPTLQKSSDIYFSEH